MKVVSVRVECVGVEENPVRVVPAEEQVLNQPHVVHWVVRPEHYPPAANEDAVVRQDRSYEK